MIVSSSLVCAHGSKLMRKMTINGNALLGRHQAQALDQMETRQSVKMDKVGRHFVFCFQSRQTIIFFLIDKVITFLRSRPNLRKLVT